MKLLTRRSEEVSITFLGEEDAEVSGTFLVRERRVKDAGAFITSLELGRLAAAESRMDVSKSHMLDALRHCLSRQVGGEPIELTDEILEGLVPSVVEALLDLQGQLYGFNSEEELVGKKFQPLIEALFHLEALTSMSFGLSQSTPALPAMESSPSESGESGPSDSSTTSSGSAAGTTGASEPSTSL